jgi:hypothetical protein
MIVAGACVLSDWIEGDSELRQEAGNVNDLACLVYAAMRRAQSRDSR